MFVIVYSEAGQKDDFILSLGIYGIYDDLKGVEFGIRMLENTLESEGYREVTLQIPGIFRVFKLLRREQYFAFRVEEI